MGSPSFFSPYRHGFVRVAAAVPKVKLADPAQNADRVLDLVRQFTSRTDVSQVAVDRPGFKLELRRYAG